MNRILVVDDDAELRSHLCEILKMKEYVTDEASSGEDALKMIQAKDFDLVLLDLMMPRMNGMDVLSELKKVRPKTSVVLITAFATIDNAVEAIKRGARDYISKPFKIDELHTTIRRVLEEARFDRTAENLELDDTLSSLTNPIRRKIIKLLDLNVHTHLMELVRELEIEDHTKVIFHLRVLKEAGIIAQDKEKTYYLTNEGEDVLQCLRILESHLFFTKPL